MVTLPKVVNATTDTITSAALERGELRRALARHVDSADKRRLLGALAAEPDRGFPLPRLLKYVRADQLTLVLFMEELECARLVQAVRTNAGRGYRLAPVAGLSEMITRLNRSVLSSFDRRLSPLGVGR